MRSDSPFDTKDFSQITNDLLDYLASGENGRPALTDRNEGSVIRTLAEAFARELAVCYQQLRYVYQYGYLDTAEGVALDNVVALLGVSRQRAGHIEGNVTFARPQPAPEDIPIPASTQVSGRDVPLFATASAAVLLKGNTEISVKVRSLEPSSEAVKANALNLMPRPIWGIDTVINPTDLLSVQREESDAELRARTKNLLQTANLGTTAAIEQAVRALGIAQVIVREDMQKAGVVDVVLGDTDISADLLVQAKEAVQRVRPAGIRVNVFLSNQILIGVTAVLVLREDYPLAQQQSIIEQISKDLVSYFASLKTGELVLLTKVRAILTAPTEIAELVENKSIFSSFSWQNDTLNNVDNSHLATNGDIRIESNERAILDVQRLPLALSLEPPVLNVWLDILIDTIAGTIEPTVENLTQKITPYLDTLKVGNSVSYVDLQDALGLGQYNSLQFRLLHSQTNLTVELKQTADSDSLKAREKLRLGRIDIK
ncbi:MAG: baseplate J/gp47 family protein [Methylococcaceae bacterium]